MSSEAARKKDEPSVACNPAALDAEQRESKRSLQRRLSTDVQEIWELPDGYAFRHSSEASVLLALAEFVALERLCSPFFGFEIESERGGGPLWLRITGGEEAKQVLRAELGVHA
jgi:hypothetical protein